MAKRQNRIPISLGAIQIALASYMQNDPDLYRRAMDAIFSLREKVYENLHCASSEWSYTNHDWIDGFIIIFEAWTDRFKIHEIYVSSEPLPPFAGFAVKAEAGHIRIKLADVRDAADAVRNLLLIELGQLGHELRRLPGLRDPRELAATDALRARLQSRLATNQRGNAGATMLETLTLTALDDAKFNGFSGLQMALTIVLARHRFTLADHAGALNYAAKALAIATRFDFRLKKIALRRLIGRILIARGDRLSGLALLRDAHLAQRAGTSCDVERARPITPQLGGDCDRS